MIHRFENFELDTGRFELRQAGARVPVEPQVFALLRLLVERRERLVTRDEIIAEVWSGRIVSDAALSSRIKSARQALGDDGSAQRLIGTRHGQGFRFLGEVEDVDPSAGSSEPARRLGEVMARPLLAVFPFEHDGAERLARRLDAAGQG